ncbi:aldo/keto reductase [Granulicoccus sp. GXG6511]|uniref:aldo/keto reductase n=1 Tax=Granulicoccus sp. GXG6511 TaxID=3381351 RepID=UPI003D7DCFD3
MTNLAPTLPLRSGGAMPQVAFGTWPMEGDECERAVRSALEVGYRHIDTAENYLNEEPVGKAVRESGLDRAEVFVTTKFNRKWHGDAAGGLQGNLDRLGLDYVDLALIHWPNPDQDLYVKAWEGLIELQRQGLAKAIGTSNFKATHIDRLIAETGVVPEVNQIEMHPYYDRAAERAYHADKGIVTEAWSPLGRDNGLREEPLVQELAAQHGKTPGQILLRWSIDVGAATAPKSANPQRQAENLDIFDFQLSAAEVEALAGLQAGPKADPMMDSDSFGH